MRYYLYRVFYNKDAQAEDRPQPKGYDSIDEAKKEFHSYMSQSILGSTCGWVMAHIINENGNIEMFEKWVSPEIPEEES